MGLAVGTREVICRNCAAEFSYLAGGGRSRPLCDKCEATFKWCPPCGYAIARDGFNPSRSTRDGLEGVCRQCRTRAHHSRIARGYRRNNRRSLAAQIKYRYGMTLDEWDRMLVAQGGRCAICNLPTRDLHVDHCHERGHIRGLLCSPCNLGLGQFCDDPERLLAAAVYLIERSG